MCVNQRWITNPITKRRFLINCGKCEACQQEKAQKRTLRINLETKYNVPHGYTTLFVTLTYDNNHIPFILQKDYDSFVSGLSSEIPVYRFSFKQLCSSKRVVRTLERIDCFGNYTMSNSSKLGISSNSNGYLENMLFQHGSDCFSKENNKFVYLRKMVYNNGTKSFSNIDGCIGVLYYEDFKLFMKRYLINIKRHYGIKDKISFFVCGEYGPTTLRPHFHVLLHVPTRFVDYCKRAVVESWKFDNISQREKFRKQVKVADTGVSSYVSSYVNCSVNLPFFFKTYRYFRQQHRTSQYYGVRSSYCQLPSLLEMSQKQQFTFERIVSIGGSQTLVSSPMPAYPISRYFPRFKGFSRLTGYEIYVLLSQPQNFYLYRKTLDYTDEDIHRIVVSLRNHYIRYCECLDLPLNDYTLYNYAIDFYAVWRSYYSFLLKLSYDCVKTSFDLLHHFVNWSDYIWDNPFISDLIESSDFELVTDPNNFVSNLSNHYYLLSLYENYNKSRKVKNLVYSQNSICV